MAFPKNPTAGEEYTVDGVTYAWNPIEDSWERFSEPAHALEWEAGRTYLAIGEMVHRDGHLYRSRAETTGDDPALAPNKSFWQRISTKTFIQGNDPTTAAGGEWEVIIGDKWVAINSMPQNAVYKEGNMVFTWIQNAWKQLSGIRVIKEGDSYTTYDKVTELLIVEKHIDGTSQEKGAVSFDFIGRDNHWHTIKIWDMPWGYHTAYRTGTSWSVDFYGGIPVTQSVLFKKGRSYMVQWGIAILNDSSNAQAIEGSVKIGSSTVAYDGGFAQNYNSVNFGSTWFYDHSGANSSRTITIVVGTVSHQIKWSKAWFYITDQGPA